MRNQYQRPTFCDYIGYRLFHLNITRCFPPPGKFYSFRHLGSFQVTAPGVMTCTRSSSLSRIHFKIYQPCTWLVKLICFAEFHQCSGGLCHIYKVPFYIYCFGAGGIEKKGALLLHFIERTAKKKGPHIAVEGAYYGMVQHRLQLRKKISDLSGKRA